MLANYITQPIIRKRTYINEEIFIKHHPNLDTLGTLPFCSFYFKFQYVKEHCLFYHFWFGKYTNRYPYIQTFCKKFLNFFFVIPSGLEPELFWAKIRCVTNYTKGQ